MPKAPGSGTIASVSPGSVAEELGLRPGDRILAVDGHLLADVIDFRYLTATDQFELLTERDGQQTLYDVDLAPAGVQVAPLTAGVQEDGGESLGIEFEDPLFDGLRRCRNRCSFCFVRQLPRGLRRTLYVRDDDFRYSFLYGNFITLTNLSQADWQRLAEQRLSPLYISVHATEQGTRDRMLGIREHPPILAKLDWLRQHGLRYHAQLVLVPGVNDGPSLDGTLADLLQQGEAMLSVSAVPVGLTAYSPPGARSYTAAEGRAVLRQLRRWRLRYARESGSARVYASDELFLLSGATLPSARYYADFPLIENGVGLVRGFLEGWKRATRRLRAGTLPGDGRLVICGTLIAPVWQRLAAEMNALGANVTVLAVTNQALGETVTVSGLLFARDVLAAIALLRADRRPAAVYLPRSMFNSEGTLTLDGLSPTEIGTRAGLPVIVASDAADVLAPRSGDTVVAAR